MPSAATLERFIARVEQNAHAEAIEAFYAEDASMQENNAPPRVGRDGLVAHERRVLGRARSVTSACVRPVFVDGDRVVIRWVFDFEWKDGSTSHMEEIAVQRWDGERIAEERFFYDPAQMRPAKPASASPAMTPLQRTVRTLARYNAWADRLIYAAVRGLPEGEADKPRVSLFKNIVHMLNHNYVIDRIFQAHLEGREHGYAARNTPDHPPLDELWPAQAAVDDWYVAWSDRVTAAELEERVEFTFVGGGRGAMTRAEILLHVVNHTTYHRGFVADLFYQIPARPPTTDLPVFLRDVTLDPG